MGSPQSAPIEVVTRPGTSQCSVLFSDTKTNQVQFSVAGVVGANYYFATYGRGAEEMVVGESNQPTFWTNPIFSPAMSGSLTVYPARVSSAGYAAYGYGKAVSVLTLSKKVSTDNFGCTNALDNINVYYFDVVLGEGTSQDGYQMQFYTTGGKKKTYTSSSSNFRIEKFINGKFYKYRVRTYVETSTGKKYSSWSGYNYIGVPKNMKCVRYSKKIKLSWKKLSGATGYDVYISTKKDSGYKKVKSLGKNSTSITITKCKGKSLKKNKTYYVKLVPKAKFGKKTYKSGTYFYWTCEP